MKNTFIHSVKNHVWLEQFARNLYYRFPYRYLSSIAGKNNQLIFKGNVRKCKVDIIGDNNTIEIGERSFVSDSTFFIRGNNHQIKIGEDCRLKKVEFWHEDLRGEIQIDDFTTIESGHLAVTEPDCKIRIGKDCMFSTNIQIRTGDSHSILDLGTNKRINRGQDVRIFDRVWVGANSIILKGSTIGNDSVIGTGSIVTNKVPANVIASGIPARIVKENVKWLRERIYD